MKVKNFTEFSKLYKDKNLRYFENSSKLHYIKQKRGLKIS